MKIFTGTVKHTKMEKTAVVDVTQTVAHPVYGKRMKKTKIYLVHDEIGVKSGDIVQFVACRPISKRKKWKIIDVVTGKTKKKKSKSKSKKSENKATKKTKKGTNK